MSLRESVVLVLYLFRGHVSDGPDNLPPNRDRAGKSRRIGGGGTLQVQVFRQSKIQKLGVTTAVHKNVRRLEVAMDDVSSVRRFKSIGDLQSQIEKRFQRQRTSSNPGLQGMALQQLHRNEILAVLFPDVVDGAYIRMVQGGSRLGFPLEARQGLRVSGKVHWEGT